MAPRWLGHLLKSRRADASLSACHLLDSDHDLILTGIENLRGVLGTGYQGPRPIVGHGIHRYRFMLFAVEGDIDVTSQRTAIDSMVGHVVARGRLVGTYER